MKHGNSAMYWAIGAVALVTVFAFGVNPAYLFLLLVCPLMMVFMMRAMGGMNGEDHTGHGCEHDPSRQSARHSDAPTEPRA